MARRILPRLAWACGLGGALPMPTAPAQERPATTQCVEQGSDPAPASQPAGPEPVEDGASRPMAAAPPEPKRGPQYQRLRYEDDFSYLDGPPDSYQHDFFDPIKNIHLRDDLRLDIGGETRFRMEAETNKDFDLRQPTQDTFELYRYFLHLDLKYGNLARVFAQGIAAFEENRDLPDRVSDENRWDMNQLFGDLRILGEGVPLTLRVGRQQFLYGNQRLIGPSDWTNVTRRFDAVRLLWSDNTWNFDVWYAKPVVVKQVQGDDWNEDIDFYGAYATLKAVPRHGLDLYFLAIDDTANSRNPNGQSGDQSRYTIGGRFWGATAGFDYETELLGQWGHWAGDTIQAWAWVLYGGYTWKQAPMTPRAGFGFDWGSGDEDPNDGKVGTLDDLFPTGHSHLGILDIVGRRNTTAVSAHLSAWPVKDRVKATLSHYSFWLTDDRDALYDKAGQPFRRDPTGHSGTEVGNEFDVTLEWKIDVHSDLLFGYSHFWDSDFIIQTGKSEDPDLFYLQYRFRF